MTLYLLARNKQGEFARSGEVGQTRHAQEERSRCLRTPWQTERKGAAC
jgi:hypothetical protein